jgi:hypothetical protein
MIFLSLIAVIREVVQVAITIIYFPKLILNVTLPKSQQKKHKHTPEQKLSADSSKQKKITKTNSINLLCLVQQFININIIIYFCTI